MDFQPVYDVVKMNSLGVIGVARTQVEARLLPQNGGTIAKVLSISASPRVRLGEVFTGEARIVGRVELCVLYLCGEGKNRVMRHVAEFTDKITSPEITSESKLFVTATVSSVEVTAVSSDEIRLSAVVESTLTGDRERELTYLSSASGAKVKTCELGYNALACTCFDRASLSASITDEKLAEVLTCEHRIAVESVTALNDAIKIDGNIITDVCGESEDGLLASCRIETPFSREIEAVGAQSGDVVQVFASVGGTTTDREIEYDVELSAAVYRPLRLLAACDAFSPECELTVSTQNVTVEADRRPVVTSERVDGSVTLDDGMPAADNILASSALKLELVGAVAGDGEILLEGVVSGNVVYYGAEAESESSVAVELPFSIKTPADDVCADDEITASGEITGVALKLRRGNEIDVRALICFTVRAKSVTETSVITSIEVSGEREKSDYAFTVYVAGEGETVWDVAKALGCDPDEVTAQNAISGGELSAGQRVIVYRSDC